jgi:hypothetical protein
MILDWQQDWRSELDREKLKRTVRHPKSLFQQCRGQWPLTPIWSLP